MKVLFISHWYPHRYDTMAGLFVRKHAEAVNLYCDTAVLYVHPDEHINRFEVESITENGFPEIKVYYPASNKNFFSKIKKHWNYFRAYRKGFAIIKKEFGLPDIVQANVFTRTALMAYLIKLRYKIPYAVIEHWTRYLRPQAFNNIIHKKVSSFTARKASAIMPVTHNLQENMQLHGMKNDNYIVINNVVDDIFFEPAAVLPGAKKRIINITCFDDQQKNLSGLLRTAHKLYQERQDFELYLIGDGNDFGKIKKLAEELGIAGKAVFFTGTLYGKPLVDMYNSSICSVLFSNYENMPVVISESLVCGIPVVSTRVGGIAGHINESNGILIEKGDEKALLNSLDYMLDHYQEYDKENIKKTAAGQFSYTNVGKTLKDIYSGILKSVS